MNQNRTALLLQAPPFDKVAYTHNESTEIIVAVDFDVVTDLHIGSDGYLYFVVYDEGKIYKTVAVGENPDQVR